MIPEKEVQKEERALQLGEKCLQLAWDMLSLRAEQLCQVYIKMFQFN